MGTERLLLRDFFLPAFKVEHAAAREKYAASGIVGFIDRISSQVLISRLIVIWPSLDSQLSIAKRGFLYRPDLSVHGLSGDNVPRAVRDSPHQRLDRAMGRDVARSRAGNRAPAPGLLGPRPAALHRARSAELI